VIFHPICTLQNITRLLFQEPVQDAV